MPAVHRVALHTAPLEMMVGEPATSAAVSSIGWGYEQLAGQAVAFAGGVGRVRTGPGSGCAAAS